MTRGERVPGAGKPERSEQRDDAAVMPMCTRQSGACHRSTVCGSVGADVGRSVRGRSSRWVPEGGSARARNRLVSWRGEVLRDRQVGRRAPPTWKEGRSRIRRSTCSWELLGACAALQARGVGAVCAWQSLAHPFCLVGKRPRGWRTCVAYPLMPAARDGRAWTGPHT